MHPSKSSPNSNQLLDKEWHLKSQLWVLFLCVHQLRPWSVTGKHTHLPQGLVGADGGSVHDGGTASLILGTLDFGSLNVLFFYFQPSWRHPKKKKEHPELREAQLTRQHAWWLKIALNYMVLCKCWVSLGCPDTFGDKQSLCHPLAFVAPAAKWPGCPGGITHAGAPVPVQIPPEGAGLADTRWSFSQSPLRREHWLAEGDGLGS